MTDVVKNIGWLEARGFRHATSNRMRRQRGLTLIEAATVLAILAFVVAGIMMLYTSADQSRKTTAALSELASIQQAVRSVYGGQASYVGLNNTAMVNSQALPSKMIPAGGTDSIRHSFGGAVTIEAAAAGDGPGSGFSVQFDNIPKDPCVKLVSSDLGRGLFSVSTPNGSRTQDTTPPPFTPATAPTACASNSSNSITWVFN